MTQDEMPNAEDAWKAVEQYFPESSLYVKMANERLARLYLGSRPPRFDEALTVYQEFTKSDNEPHFYATGLAGQAIIASLRKNYERSNRLISELAPLLDRPETMLDPSLRRSLQEVIDINRRHSGQPVRPGLQDLFETMEEQNAFE